MKQFLSLVLLSLCIVSVTAQNEAAPLAERPFAYKDWTLKDVQRGKDVNLRQATAGKKLVMVVYWAPWCLNWRHDAEFVQGLYARYKDKGFEVIGVASYDPLDSMRQHIKQFKLTFPSVYETVERTDREKTEHFKLRREAGDARKWGSPWYVFLEPPKFLPAGQPNLTIKTMVINGEMKRPETEKYIREKLGLAAGDSKTAVNKKGEIEACEPDKKIGELIKP